MKYACQLYIKLNEIMKYTLNEIMKYTLNEI